MTVYTQKEKLTDRLVILIPPSTRNMIQEVENTLGLDTPEFLRNLVKNALQELKTQASA